MAVLSGQFLTLSVNERGQIDALYLNGGRNMIARPVGLFRAILRTGDNWEDVAFAEQQTPRISQGADTIVITADQLKTRDGVRDISVTMTIRLQNDRLTFDSEIRNASDSVVNEWIYPCIGTVETLEGGQPDLLFPRCIGERIVHVCDYLKSMDKREALHEISAAYPSPMSMQWMLLEDGDTCLYLSGRDDLFYTGALRAKGSDEGGVTLEMNKFGFVKPGETWVCPSYLLWPYRGSWMEAAREYADWASTWRKPVKPKEWTRRMNGYFLVINKQQFGDEIWPYDTIPWLYDYAAARGFDTLGLFGWYHTGHDNNYPDLDVSPTMGGDGQLKAGIRAIQEKGGHVTLYCQGHLMDVNSDYYKKTGHRLEGKTRWGTPYYEFYDKFCRSDYLHYFSRKAFSTVCPSCPEWHELMAGKADWIHSSGADGILYDQIGGMPPYPCFDESHPHKNGKPSLSHTQGRIALHRRIREQVDSYENFAYMTEHVTDVHSQFLDCLHGIGSQPGPKETGTPAPGIRMMPELFRYTFPETLITIRNPLPYVTRRFANYALTYGFKLEMELRYQTDRDLIEADERPEDREYVTAVSALRRCFEDTLLTGRFLAQEGLTRDMPDTVKSTVFIAENGRKAVVLWNDGNQASKIRLMLAGTNLNAWCCTDGEGTGIPEEIEPDRLMVLYSCE